MHAGGPAFAPLCQAVSNAAAAGLVTVVAAGNEARSFSGFTPANCFSAIAVTSYDSSRAFSGFRWVMQRAAARNLTPLPTAETAGQKNGSAFLVPCFPDLPSAISCACSNFLNSSTVDVSHRTHVVSGPGGSIVSTYNTSDGSYATLSGTSMATPHVAGVVARWAGGVDMPS